jgi:hypothetical protein
LYRTGVPGAQTNLNGLQAGEFVEFFVHLDSAGCFLETNFPVGVCSYIKFNINVVGVFTIPSQTWIPGINQSVTSAIIAPFAFSSSSITHHYALIYTSSLTKENTKVSIGDAPPTALSGGIWRNHAISGMSFYSMPLTNHYTTYTFSNPEGVIVFGYGVNNANTPASYYYLAYSAMRDLDAAFFANDIHFQDLKDNPICESEITFRAEIEGLHQTAADRIRWFIEGAEQYAEQNKIVWNKTFSVGEYEIRMLVRYENNDTVSKTGTLKICSLDAAFYANDVHNEVLPDTTFCNKTVHFRAETGALSTEPEHIRWYVDYNDGNGYVEELSALDLTQWSKNFENGTFPVKMWVRFENGVETTITSTLKVQALWIKIKNVRY